MKLEKVVDCIYEQIGDDIRDDEQLSLPVFVVIDGENKLQFISFEVGKKATFLKKQIIFDVKTKQVIYAELTEKTEKKLPVVNIEDERVVYLMIDEVLEYIEKGSLFSLDDSMVIKILSDKKESIDRAYKGYKEVFSQYFKDNI